MHTTIQSLSELSQAASQVLTHTRKMVMRGDSRLSIEDYLRECRSCFLHATQEWEGIAKSDVVQDLARAIRYASPNAELLGALVVLAALSNQDSSTDFHCFSLGANQRVRAEVRDHTRLGVCDPADIKLGAELALRSLQPLAAA